MAKQSQIEKAIQQLEGERQVLDLAILRLRAQLETKKPKKADKPARPTVAPELKAAG